MNTGGNMEKLSVNALTYDSEVRRGCMDGGLFYMDGFLRRFCTEKK